MKHLYSLDNWLDFLTKMLNLTSWKNTTTIYDYKEIKMETLNNLNEIADLKIDKNITFTTFLDYCESYGVRKIYFIQSKTQDGIYRLEYALILPDALRMRTNMLNGIERNGKVLDVCDIFEANIKTIRQFIEDWGDCGFTFENARIAFDKSIDNYAFVERLEKYHIACNK